MKRCLQGVYPRHSAARVSSLTCRALSKSTISSPSGSARLRFPAAVITVLTALIP